MRSTGREEGRRAEAVKSLEVVALRICFSLIGVLRRNRLAYGVLGVYPPRKTPTSWATV